MDGRLRGVVSQSVRPRAEITADSQVIVDGQPAATVTREIQGEHIVYDVQPLPDAPDFTAQEIIAVTEAAAEEQPGELGHSRMPPAAKACLLRVLANSSSSYLAFTSTAYCPPAGSFAKRSGVL